MATVWAVNPGNVSVGANWNTGVVPGISDDVYADGKDMVIDQNWTVLSIRTTQRAGGTVGGTFTIAGSYTVSATSGGFYSQTAGGGILITANAPNTVTLNGINNVPVHQLGIVITGNATVNLNITTTGGAAYACYSVLYNSTTGGNVISIGSITGGGYSLGVGNQFNSVGVKVQGNGNFIHTGNITAAKSEAIYHQGTGYVSVIGTALSSTTAPAIYGTGVGHIYFNGIADMQTPPAVTIPTIYCGTTGSGVVYFSGVLTNTSSTPCIYALRMSLWSLYSTQWVFKTEGIGGKTLYSTDTTMFGYPAEADVRDATVFGQANEFTGAYKVAPQSSVLTGVPNDNGVGTFVPGGATAADVWNYLLSSINTEDSVGKLIKDFLDAAISSRMAAGDYTAPDNANIALIKAQTDKIPDHPASVETTGDQLAALE